MKIKAEPPRSKNFDYVKSPLRRVSTKHKCEICGKPDWCNYSEDGVLALCMRISTGSIKEAGNGAFVHVLRPSVFDHAPAKAATPIMGGGGGGYETDDKADADRRHLVYSFLLEECLTLRPEHGDQLLGVRCLSDTTITTNLYASMPAKSELPKTCRMMREKFGEDLRGVPGFYLDEVGGWKIFHVDGLVIPVRDVRGRIAALQIRPDKIRKTKYLWFSTTPEKYPGGASSGSPLHFTKPDLVRQSGFTLITEGALKADVISEIFGCSVVGIAGVTAFNAETFGVELCEALPELRRVGVAYDADWRTNKAVRNGLKRLLLALGKTKLQVIALDWEAARGKGLDDYWIGRMGLSA